MPTMLLQSSFIVAAAHSSTTVLLVSLPAKMSKPVYLLTGDVGGTNSRMSLYLAESLCTSIDDPVCVKYFRNAEYLPTEKLSDKSAFSTCIVVPFLEHCWKTCGGDQLVSDVKDCEILACLATAGLVLQNSVQMTNLGNLLVDGTAMEQDSSNSFIDAVKTCRIINDFVAQGYGCLTLNESEVRHLHGPKTPLSKLLTGPKICVGAGTGLGECYLTPSGDGSYVCFPSEGGHAEYAPRNDLELDLWKYLSDKFSSKHRVSVERVVSGKGLANVYEFLSEKCPDRVIQTIHKEFLEAGDEQGRVVAENSKQPGCSLCRQAMEIMMNAYGCEVGSAAIKWIPVGGLFVTGGLTPKNIDYIEGENSDFLVAYKNKGRVAPLLERIPLYAVMTEDLGVRGVHKAAKSLYESRGGAVRSKKTPWDMTAALVTAAALGFVAGAFLSKRR